MTTLMAAAFAAALASPAAETDSKLYELRIYYCHPGRLDALHARFRDHTMKLFAKHGIENVGYFVPADNRDLKLVYLIAHQDRAARDASFKAFGSDPLWKTAQKASEAAGPIVKKIEERFLSATDFSPKIAPAVGTESRVFELRTYTASPGNLAALDSRFRDHTIKLFEKHGMANLAYWHYAAKQPHADAMLVYLLSHKDQAAAKKSFGAFGADPAWKAARKASEDKAGGALTVKDGGVKSEFLVPTDYSPWK